MANTIHPPITIAFKPTLTPRMVFIPNVRLDEGRRYTIHA